MYKLLLALQAKTITVHDEVHDLVYKTPFNLIEPINYSVTKIFTGGVNMTLWNQLSPADKEKNMSKDWYIYYSFRDKSGKLKRMPNIKGGANKIKNKPERLHYLNVLRDALELLLKKGLNPYEDNDLSKMEDTVVTDQNTSILTQKPSVLITESIETPTKVQPKQKNET